MLVLGRQSWSRWLKPSKNSVTGITGKQIRTYEKCHKHNDRYTQQGEEAG